jgi:hypothetical protein
MKKLNACREKHDARALGASSVTSVWTDLWSKKKPKPRTFTQAAWTVHGTS